MFYISKANRSNMGLTTIIPALRQRQKNHEFKASLGCNAYYIQQQGQDCSLMTENLSKKYDSSPSIALYTHTHTSIHMHAPIYKIYIHVNISLLYI